MNDSRWVLARAPAKVNPWLEVLGRREDGFHEIETTMLALELADELRVCACRVEEGQARIRLSISGPAATEDIPCDERNLVWRAAEGVLELGQASGALGADAGVQLRLEKRVPSQAGLGGGSSDAAAAALATCAVHGLDFGSDVLMPLLSKLGSDCAFFAAAAGSGHAVCRGRGEIVEPLAPVPPGWHVSILVPSAPSPTAEVYRALEFPLREKKPADTVRPNQFHESESGARRTLFNRLEEPALQVVSELRRWRNMLDRNGASHFRMSGSGSSFFGLYRDRSVAEGHASQLERAARSEGLELRGRWVTRPAGFGTWLSDAENSP